MLALPCVLWSPSLALLDERGLEGVGSVAQHHRGDHHHHHHHHQQDGHGAAAHHTHATLPPPVPTADRVRFHQACV